MKKTGKFLSMILALVMAFALAVPAFAETIVDVTFSVDPIGTATIKGEDEWGNEVSYENVYVFDQDVVATQKAGGGFTMVSWNDVIRGIGGGGDSAQEGFELSADTSGIWDLGSYGRIEYEDGEAYEGFIIACHMITKAYLDKLTAAGFTVTLTPLGQSAPAAKPAPGVAVPLNDGTGEFAYTIKYGDSLSKIAAYYYGDLNVYKLIFERNKDVLKNANTIYAGQTIILPSYAAVAEFQAAAK